MNKPYNIILILMLIMNVVIGGALFHQTSLLTEYKSKINNLELKVEDLDGVIKERIVPGLREVSNKDDWITRNTYTKNGKVILEVMEDPSLRAGKSFGYIFSFSEPFETFNRKELAIYAYHKETGDKITVVPPKIITNPSSGYPSLERFIAFFKIPISGLWRFEAEIDGEFYADVILLVKE
ncbi:hypothetical protein ACFFHH_00575 [Cytobacillus solani]|uniref:DUF4871 domain-containing protein n=1 Tax=Cytobacillus solani TaxID=1637975 RepID=A0A0Q3VFW8_9BACI|nr:hypothetical protein [Cytobacillus solani]KOP81214.1 hypothetical protein AMS60_01070 [Bacillus sp. FJAT-21945]KQL18227.1 hypothetical protein AN957_06255 [Cytobacillus solani]USK56069.1 hypothetical protein LIS82_06110 [Cytobacillus solani]